VRVRNHIDSKSSLLMPKDKNASYNCLVFEHDNEQFTVVSADAKGVYAHGTSHNAALEDFRLGNQI
jgi:hypothetical protein